MIARHRQRIDLCAEDILPRLNMIALWPKLLENGIYHRDDVNVPRWTKCLENPEIIRDIYLTIKTRGPSAFESLIVSLKETGQQDLADLLEGRRIRARENNLANPSGNRGKNGGGERRTASPAPEPNGGKDSFFSYMQQSDEPLEIHVKKATEFLDGPIYKNVQRYPMRSKPRGLVLTITNIHYQFTVEPPRKSAEHDERNLRVLFEQMGFRVESFRDLSSQALIDRVKEFSQRKDLRMVDSCFVVISSHGHLNEEHERTEILGVDYYSSGEKSNLRTVLCSDITDCFITEACPQLAGKPKIFIFQMCRGEKKQKAVAAPRHIADSCNFTMSQAGVIGTRTGKNAMSVRNYADMLVAHATTSGHVAFRDAMTGSWFIQILCEVFMNYARTTHVQDLLNMVDDRLNTVRTMKEECQTLTVTSMGFNKHCYLHPGFFEDDT